MHDSGAEAAAYVLGALEPAEEEAFGRHLEECETCREEVAAFRQVVRALPMSAPQQPAPKGLRRRVLREIGQEQRRTRSRTGRPAWIDAWRIRSPLALAAATAVLVAIVVVPLELTGGAGSRVIEAQVSGISGTAQLKVGPSASRGELIVEHLSPPPAGHIYEVWLQAADRPPAPAGVLFSVKPGGSADLRLPGSLHRITQLMVTPEPDGGSPAPTHTPVIVARLS